MSTITLSAVYRLGLLRFDHSPATLTSKVEGTTWWFSTQDLASIIIKVRSPFSMQQYSLASKPPKSPNTVKVPAKNLTPQLVRSDPWVKGEGGGVGRVSTPSTQYAHPHPVYSFTVRCGSHIGSRDPLLSPARHARSVHALSPSHRFQPRRCVKA